MLILLLVLIALCGYGVWEYFSHQKRLQRIRLRIHVNGSRGKSSVTRLIAAGLRAGGIRTIAKTTGTLPRIIDLDGGEIAINRAQRANIIEQVKILSFIDRFKPEALVMECMAVQPEYQWICERQMIRSHIGVITNCRLDHTNEMGKFREQISRSLGNTCPTNGALYTSEKTNLPVLTEIARQQHTDIYRIGGAGVRIEELRRFGHIEHPANVGLALAVCERAGVDRETALEGMYKSAPDPGALRIAVCHKDGKELMFVNALAANDPESTLEVWNQIVERYGLPEFVVIMLNSRADRQDRSVQLIEMIAANIQFDYIILTGEKSQKFLTDLTHHGIPKKKTVVLGREKPEKTYNELFNLTEDKGTILAIGNAGAGGLDIFWYFYKQRILPIGVICPHCDHSLMDKDYLIDSFPSILVNMAHGDHFGWLRLSTIYGSYNIETGFDVSPGDVVRMYCPYCKKELISDTECPECGIQMISMGVPAGETAFICPQRGCKGHLIIPEIGEENNPDQSLKPD